MIEVSINRYVKSFNPSRINSCFQLMNVSSGTKGMNTNKYIIMAIKSQYKCEITKASQTSYQAYVLLLSSQTFAFQAKLVTHNNLLAVAFYADNSVFRGSQKLFMSFLYI